MYFKLLGIIILSYHLEKALNDSICRHFVGLMWLDWTALNFTESDLTGAFFWIELYSNGWHRTALGCTSLVSAGMFCSRHCAPDWNTLQCTSVSGTGLDWTGQLYTTLLQLAYIDLGSSGWRYTAMYLHGWDLTWVDGTGLEWAGQDCTGPDSDTLHCTGLL